MYHGAELEDCDLLICDSVPFVKILKKEAAHSLETLRNINPKTRCHIIEAAISFGLCNFMKILSPIIDLLLG